MQRLELLLLADDRPAVFALAVEPDTPHHVGWASATTADATGLACALSATYAVLKVVGESQWQALGALAPVFAIVAVNVTADVRTGTPGDGGG